MLAVFGLMPGMPVVSLLHPGRPCRVYGPHLQGSGGFGRSGRRPRRWRGARAPGSGKGGATAPAAASHVAADDVRKLTEVDVFTIEIGHGLLGLADTKAGGRPPGPGDRRAQDDCPGKGIVVPPISVRDNLELESNAYRFLLRGKADRARPADGRTLARDERGGEHRATDGCPHQGAGLQARRDVDRRGEKRNAELNGYTVVDAASVLITHLSEALKANAHLLLGRQDVQSLLDHLKESHPALVTELVPDLVNIGIIQRVLQNLLRENVAILNLPLILECIADFASLSKNPDDLSELARRRLGMYFVPAYESRPGIVRALHARSPLRAVARRQDPPLSDRHRPGGRPGDRPLPGG
jgi:flagellar biosynthesis protein FlhA